MSKNRKRIPLKPFIFRVHRTVVDGQTVEVRLEPFPDTDIPIHIHAGDEFVTGGLALSMDELMAPKASS